jgi:hypothetical protein
MVPRLCLVLLLLCVGCTMAVPSETPGYAELLVSQHLDTAYARVQRTTATLGLETVRTQDAARIVTVRRPTGEQLTISVQPLGLSTLIAIRSTPASDVSDVVRAYQAQR